MLTVDARLELFKKQFPREKIKSVVERQGTDHEILEINHTWMCKSGKTEQSALRLAQEYALLTKLDGKILTQIPKPEYYQDNFLVYKKIAGSPLFSYAFLRLGNNQKSKLVCDIVDFLSQLRQALTQEEIEALGYAKVEIIRSTEQLEDEMAGLDYPAEVKNLFTILMQDYERVMTTALPATLVHNNLSMPNIIINSLTGQLQGIIGFSDVAYDDPSLDLRLHAQNPVEFNQAISFVHAVLHEEFQSHKQKIYQYFFATEISRYVQLYKSGEQEQAVQVCQNIAQILQRLHKINNANPHQAQEQGFDKSMIEQAA